MSDAEEDEFEQLRIRQLATMVATSLEAVIAKADEQMSADAKVVQGLLTTLALENGEFELPVPASQLNALRAAIREASPPLDEGFVATVKAYMKKSSDDGLEGSACTPLGRLSADGHTCTSRSHIPLTRPAHTSSSHVQLARPARTPSSHARAVCADG